MGRYAGRKPPSLWGAIVPICLILIGVDLVIIACAFGG